jgi:hypothetical protein
MPTCTVVIEHTRSPIAALREVMRDSRNNDSCDSFHETEVARWSGRVKAIRSPSPNFLHVESLSLLPIFSFPHLVIFFGSCAFYGGICVHCLLGRCTNTSEFI